MTRYLCAHPGHERDGHLQPVDLSAQVRMERAFVPRSSVYLAFTEDVIRRVRDLPARGGDERLLAVKQIITGTPWPLDAPVLLVSESRVQRTAGLYELDELRTSERPIDDLFRRTGEGNRRGDGSDDLLVVLDDDPGTAERTRAIAGEAPSAQPVAVSQPVAQRARVIPQGTFPVNGLALRLAQAPSDEEAIVDAIRSTPSFGEIRSDEVRRAWRVVVACPVATGLPLATHRIVFTGTGDPEPGVVFGTPAEGTWDEVLEDAAVEDLAPPAAVSREERRLWGTLLVEAVLGALLLLAGWISGGLGTAVRETPGWFGMGMALAVAAVAIAAFGVFAPHDAHGNANDTLVLRRFYDSRIDLLWWSSILTVSVFALALIVAIVPPIVASGDPIPAPAVSFASDRNITTATVRLDVGGVASDEVLVTEARQFGPGDTGGMLVGRWSATGDTDGTVHVDETMALDPEARYLSIQVVHQGSVPPACTPSAIGVPGCTVLAVPPRGAGVNALPVSVIAPTATPSATPSSTEPSTSLSATLSPGIASNVGSPSAASATVTTSASP